MTLGIAALHRSGRNVGAAVELLEKLDCAPQLPLDDLKDVALLILTGFNRR
jgi:hypothetical protein